MMKKNLAVLMTCMLVLSMAACGNSGETTPKETVVQKETQPAESKSDTAETKGTDAADVKTADPTEKGTSQGEGEITLDKSVEPPSGFTPEDVVPDKKYKIAFANFNSTNAGAAIMAEEIEKAAKYYGVELLSMDNKQDPLQAVDNFNNAKTWGCEYYIQYNEDPEANKRIGEMLKADNIPAIAVQVPLGDDFPYYRLDPAESGRVGGEALAKKAKEKWGDDVAFFICMDCPEAGQVIQDRAEAATAAVKEIYPDIKVITYSSEGDPEVSRNKMTDVLTANPEGNFMFWGHMDQWTLAAVSSIRAAGREEQCIATSVMGLDSMIEEMQRVGTPVYGTVAIRPEVWAWELLPKAIQELNTGEKPELDMYQPCILLTLDNLSEIYPDKVKK
ncbi:sugar ABC transporter substrate-binding protein [Robinsoniella peoriensis]